MGKISVRGRRGQGAKKWWGNFKTEQQQNLLVPLLEHAQSVQTHVIWQREQEGRNKRRLIDKLGKFT
jgi:hypothetical protein